MSLSSVHPTPQELQAAQELFEHAKDPTKKMASTMASFKSWCQRAGAKDNQEALQSSGEARKRFMMDYLVMNARHKKARVEAVSQRSVVHHKKNLSRGGWKSHAYVEGKVGQNKLEAWIACTPPAIKSRPDPRTGSSDKEMCDYWYDSDWEENELDDATGLDMKGTSVTADLDNMTSVLDSLAMGSPSASSAGPPSALVEVK